MTVFIVDASYIINGINKKSGIANATRNYEDTMKVFVESVQSLHPNQ